MSCARRGPPPRWGLRSPCGWNAARPGSVEKRVGRRWWPACTPTASMRKPRPRNEPTPPPVRGLRAHDLARATGGVAYTDDGLTLAAAPTNVSPSAAIGATLYSTGSVLQAPQAALVPLVGL